MEDEIMLNGKFICTRTSNSEGFMTKNKIYTFEDGVFTKDNDYKEVVSVDSFRDFNNKYFAQIAPAQLTLKEEFLIVGRVIELRNGWMGFVLPDRIITENGWHNISDYTDDLKDCDVDDDEFDIMEIFDAPIIGGSSWNFGCSGKIGYSDLLPSVWKRIEKTSQQIEIEYIESQMRKLADELNKLKGK